ncbi:MAG: hypothetical protein V4726_04935 [Verrucomicrobiota bacterium]
MSAAKFLYILCEGERDEMFYERLCERITGQTYIQPQDFRVRRGSNFKTAMAAARVLISRFKHWPEPQDVAVIIAVDNDRAPAHPGGKPAPRPLPPLDLKKSARYPALVEMITAALGPDPGNRVVNVALAVPVEMIESWLLMLLNPDGGELPLFSEISPISRQYYGGGTPPPQLKELRDAEAAKLGLDLDTLFYNAADQGDLDRLAVRSESFALFRRDLLAWRGVGDRVP